MIRNCLRRGLCLCSLRSIDYYFCVFDKLALEILAHLHPLPYLSLLVTRRIENFPFTVNIEHNPL